MKRFICAITCILLILFLLIGCSKKNDGPVTLTILMEENAQSNKSAFENKFQELVDYLHPDKSIIVTFEYLVQDTVKRDAQLAQVRASIMAGKGPDIFILPTWDPISRITNTSNELVRTEPLFTDMEDAMRNGTFLILDEYISNSEHLNMDEHLEEIMSVGVTEEGQVVLPYTFACCLNFIDRNRMENPDIVLNSIEDIRNCQDTKLLNTIRNQSEAWLPWYLTEYIDYEKEELLISENQIKDILIDYSELFIDADPDDETIGSEDVFNMFDPSALSYIGTENVYTIAMPNNKDGITALISSFTAINRNTSHPDEAFAILELLYNSQIQTDGQIRVEGNEKYLTHLIDSPSSVGANEGIFTCKNAYTEFYYPTGWQEVQNILDKINCARFPTEMDCMLYDVCADNFGVLLNGDGDSIDFDAIAAELYSDWKMMIAE